MAQRGMLEHLKRCRKAKALWIKVSRGLQPHYCLSVTVSVELTVINGEILKIEGNMQSIDHDCSILDMSYVCLPELLGFCLFCGCSSHPLKSEQISYSTG